MSQAEDTELRDLVVETLEKNGSLAKIRALLRANIFLAFEDDCKNSKQNEMLDRMLNIPEGKLSLCILHEFLEYCNLKNTLFVYMSESRQGKEYTYSKENFAEKLNVPKLSDKEPVLLTIIKNLMKPCQNKQYPVPQNAHQRIGKYGKDEQNCTYIVHEDTNSSSQSQSDNSSDEKNKINLRLKLDNSDTDTSSDSAKEKSSEYVPNKINILQGVQRVDLDNRLFGNDEKKGNDMHSKQINSSSESTSYMELKPFHQLDEVLLNTTGLPINDIVTNVQTHVHLNDNSLTHTVSKKSKNVDQSTLTKNESKKTSQNTLDDSGLNNTEIEYSYDFSLPNSEQRSSSHVKESIEVKKSDNTLSNHSLSSQSSISTSDVADLLSEISNRSSKENKNDSNMAHKSKFSNNSSRSLKNDYLKVNSDSSDFSESPIPSLSNLSLDIHSE